MVARRRIQGEIRFRMKPCMITCPAMVPTDEEERPEARSARANTIPAAGPRSGSSVRCASSSVPTCAAPPRWNVAAAMMSMPIFTSPATDMAMIDHFPFAVISAVRGQLGPPLERFAIEKRSELFQIGFIRSRGERTSGGKGNGDGGEQGKHGATFHGSLLKKENFSRNCGDKKR